MNKIGKLLFAGASLLCISAAAEAQTLEKFVLGWPSAASPTHAPFLMGVANGFFADEGLELEFQPLSGGTAIIPQLLTGALDAGYLSFEPIMLSKREGGQNFPITFVYNYARSNPYTLTVLEDSPIQSIRDLPGKSMGVINLGAGNLISTKAMLALNDVSWDDVEKVAVGTGSGPQQALRSGQVDVLNMWRMQDFLTERNGLKLRYLDIPEQVTRTPGVGIGVTQDMVRDNPEKIIRFGRALTKSLIACDANREACLSALYQFYPNFKPSDGNLETPLAVLNVNLEQPYDFAEGEERILGKYLPQLWENGVQTLILAGELPADSEIDLSSIYTNEFVEKMHDFDRDAVLAKAETAQ